MLEKVRRDQETRDHEEHVDTDKSAGHAVRPEVIREDEEDRDSAQALDVVTECAAAHTALRKRVVRFTVSDATRSERVEAVIDGQGQQVRLEGGP